jgi:hypothetical protein
MMRENEALTEKENQEYSHRAKQLLHHATSRLEIAATQARRISTLFGGPDFSVATVESLLVSFIGCGKKRETVILSADFARRIPLGLLV